MNKLALTILATASVLSPALASAQTVSPADRYEGTPTAELKQPARPTPPAGITWRNQAATPSVAPLGRAMPLTAAPAMRAEAPPPPPLPRTFVIRREPGAMAGDPAEFEMFREGDGDMADGPARVIVRRHGSGHMAEGPARVIVRRMDEVGSDHEGWDEDEYDGPGYDEAYEDEHHGSYGGHGYPADRSGFAYTQGPCCSGGMITETITTTTTYPPTAEERVIHTEHRSYAPRRTYKRKLRGR